jgi:hypothetical protein
MVYNRGTMKNLTIAFLAAASLMSFGCKKKGGAGEAMAKMGEFKDKMCACKDKKCADDVQDQMNKWSAESAKNAGDKPEKPDEKTMKEMQDVGTKYGECMAKAMSGGGSADTGSAAKPADPPPAAKSACVDGAYKDPSNTYCVKIPEGFTPPKASDKSDGRVRDQFDSPGNNEFNITVWTTAKFDDMKANLSSENNDAKVIEKGDYEGTGFFVNHRNEAKKESGAATLIKSGDKLISCESAFSDDEPLKPADACKTLRAM